MLAKGTGRAHDLQSISNTEVVMTFMFPTVILGVTHERAPVGFSGVAIGLALTLIHRISLPVTNASVNSGRGPAVASRAIRGERERVGVDA